MLGVLSCILLLIGGTSLYLLARANDNEPTATDVRLQSFSDTKTSVSFDYPEVLDRQDLSDEDKASKFIGRFTSMDPPMIVSVRYEDGLRAVAALSRQDPLDMVLSNIGKAYPDRYPDFKEQSRQNLALKGKEAAEVYFTYTGPNGERAKQRLLIIQTDDNTVVYVSAQAQETDFDGLNKDFFDLLFASVGS